ncbi:MAG: IPT/TIG domain-containing protein [Sandaracinaceae bacterium]|nr:IPT/TIG domain-containing protein [Sandaracinaceae bacterium]
MLLSIVVGCDGGPGLPDADVVLVDSGPVIPDGGTGLPDTGIGEGSLLLDRVVPPYGPYSGGNRVVLRGRGFDRESQVRFGGLDVQPADHRLIDDRRLEVVVPAGEVGVVDVEVTVAGETVTLTDGYAYEPITVDPNSGAVAGGTFITITGRGTSFAAGDRVTVGRGACTDVNVVSPAVITCRVPPAVAGTVDVTVIAAEDARETTATDGFTYFDSTDPFSGGLGGGPISGAINLTVIDAMTGAPVNDAYAIVGEDLSTVHQGLTDSLGQITFSGPDVMPPATVHISKFCYERTSVVAFDARDVTVFLIPWMDPMCGEGEPEPPPPGRGRNGAFIEGELIWYGPNEMGPNPWGNVPEAREGWTRVAYVYTTSMNIYAVTRDPRYANPDPGAGGSIHRVLESPTGRFGYPYSIFARPAGLAVYALAGLENDRDGRFIPYVMGVARSVLAGPGQTVTGVDVVMNIPLDHYLEVELTELPEATRLGPDRFRLRADLDLGGEGVIVNVVNDVDLNTVRRRDASRAIRFIPEPSLEGALVDGRFRVEAGWFTGSFDSQPYTVAVETGVTAIDATLRIGGFVGIPVPTAPASGERLPADRVLRWTADGATPDLNIIILVDATGNPGWRMFVPGDVREAPIPDLSSIEGIDDLTPGFITWAVFAVSIPGFEFDNFRYDYLDSRFWSRWAVDFYTAQR